MGETLDDLGRRQPGLTSPSVRLASVEATLLRARLSYDTDAANTEHHVRESVGGRWYEAHANLAALAGGTFDPSQSLAVTGSEKHFDVVLQYVEPYNQLVAQHYPDGQRVTHNGRMYQVQRTDALDDASTWTAKRQEPGTPAATYYFEIGVDGRAIINGNAWNGVNANLNPHIHVERSGGAYDFDHIATDGAMNVSPFSSGNSGPTRWRIGHHGEIIKWHPDMSRYLIMGVSKVDSNEKSGAILEGVLFYQRTFVDWTDVAHWDLEPWSAAAKPYYKAIMSTAEQ